MKKSVKFSNDSDEVFFEISQNAWTPNLNEATPVYRNPAERNAQCVAPPSTLSRPNYEGKLSYLNESTNYILFKKIVYIIEQICFVESAS